MSEKKKKPDIRFNSFSDEWEERKVKDICSISTGKSNTQDKIVDGIYPFYVRSPIIERSNRYLYDEESVLTVGDGVGTGKVFHYVNGKYDLHQRVYRMFDFNNGVLGKYFFYYFSNHFYDRVMAMTAKTSVDSVRYDMIAEMDIEFPKKSEQIEITRVLQSLDNLITLKQRKYGKLKNVKKAMLEKMFPKNGTDVPEIRFKGFSGKWKQYELSEIVDVYSGRDYKHLSNGNIPVYGTGGYMLSVNEALSYDEDAIGIGRKGTIDKPYVLKAPFWTVDTLFYAIPKEKNDLEFIFGVFQKINWKQKDESTGVPSLSKITINRVQVVVPEHTEQIKIGNYFKNLDNLIKLNKYELEKLKNIKKACLEKMFV